MGDMLTQEEINALLAGGNTESDEADAALMDEIDQLMDEDSGAPAPVAEENLDDALTGDEKDVLGEIGNISMGTAATTLFTLLNNKVLITTPRVSIKSWSVLSGSYDRPCVGIKVDYIEGVTGTNILILKEHDVKVIANLMMGGDGAVTDESALSDLELSAIGEAMNQMVGSSSTSLSSVIKRKIDIDTPKAMILDFSNEDFFDETGFAATDVLACVAFRMEIGDLIDSEITQIIPVDFAKDIVAKMMEDLIGTGPAEAPVAAPAAAAPPPPAAAAPPPLEAPSPMAAPGAALHVAPPPPVAMPGAPPPGYYTPGPGAPPPDYYAPGPGAVPGAPPAGYYAPDPRQPVMYPQQAAAPISAQPATFETLDFTELHQQKENIGIIMDVPLEVTVELGRTTRKIKEILEFAPGTIVDLDKLAGEPIDILVNGKFVASGEVVVVDENFAVRVTDIVNVDKRI